MKTKRLILMLMILALLTPLALSGCSDKTESSSQDSADDDSENDSDFEQIKGQSWMSTLDSSLSLGAIAMPGTHDSGATKDLVLPGTARCQSLTIAEQLDIGVRYFDIRLRRVDGDLHVYHGEADQELTFTQVLTDVTDKGVCHLRNMYHAGLALGLSHKGTEIGDSFYFSF